MKKRWYLIAALVIFCSIQPGASAIKPYEDENWNIPENIIDTRLNEILSRYNAKMRNPCSDYVFIRRVYLDTIGRLPTLQEIDEFINNKRPSKRRLLIDNLLEKDDFALYWAMKWCDILRVKSEYPINLWPNGVQAYHRWIYEKIRENMPYDKFARDLLTSSGSNFRVPPVNFYRAIQGRSPQSIARAVCQTFMGIDFEKLPQNQQENLALFFSRVAYKKTMEWKEEIVYLNPEPSKKIRAVFIDGKGVEIFPEEDPRIVFTNWLISPENKWFNRNIVNRIWAWIMGQGIIEPVDDTYGGKTSGKDLLVLLEDELIKSGYDLKHLIRIILNSRTYQQSSIPTQDTRNPDIQFAFYKPRQMEAEVLLDILCYLGGKGEQYVSQIPEPYTYIPRENRNIGLADGSITSTFLITFGRPSRDTGLVTERSSKPTDKQRLYMLNSSDIQRRISSSSELRKTTSQLWRNKKESIHTMYKIILSRPATDQEISAIEEYFLTSGLQPYQVVNDIAWALINSKEFIFKH
ncbi:MAG: DUF1553 domain-containing protein [Candidatus Omnitrophica bacterium]|nr:DUF1553 domain-containing protein [Candidatus Omnitrophota bacterium]